MSQESTQQDLQDGLAHFQAGRWVEAETIYRKVLDHDPQNAAALHLLGVLASQVGQPADAVALIQKAIRFNPNDALAYNNLGNALKAIGRLDDAISAFVQSIGLNPARHEAYNNLGICLQAKGQSEEAQRVYSEAIRLKPDYAQAHNNLAIAFASAGRLDEAIASYQAAIAADPLYAEAHNNLAGAYTTRGQFASAIESSRRALEIRPNLAQAHNNLGNALKASGNLDDAARCYEQAIRFKRDYAEAYNNLGIALKSLARPVEAVAAFRQAIALDPKYAAAHGNLGNAFQRLGRPDDAIQSYERAIALKPRSAHAHSNLGTAFKENAQLDQAICEYRNAIELKPDFVDAGDNLAFVILHHPAFSPAMIRAELDQWNLRYAQPLAPLIRPLANSRDPDRPLRIGYVSSDFHDHASAFFLLPLLRHHNRDHFEITCYAHVAAPDDLTRQMQQHASHWRSTIDRTDADVAQQIRDDQIDILIDLKLHCADNRLLVFAQKPAPVQVTWLGYPGTTGLTTIDYRLTDPHLDPPSRNDADYSERSIRLPLTFWCYDPLTSDPPVNAPPSQEAGYVTFGCLNNFCKVNDDVLSLWAKTLAGVYRSRLILLAPEGTSRKRVLDRMRKEGINPQRIEFVSRLPRPQYLQTYHRIDIALDTFPYNGHTTSLDSLWMGIPVITLPGQTVVSRAGLSQLTNLALQEFAAHDPEDFVKIASDLADNPPRLAEIRATLRPRMQASPLMDAAQFARDMESAYRLMWRDWCASV